MKLMWRLHVDWSGIVIEVCRRFPVRHVNESRLKWMDDWGHVVLMRMMTRMCDGRSERSHCVSRRLSPCQLRTDRLSRCRRARWRRRFPRRVTSCLRNCLDSRSGLVESCHRTLSASRASSRTSPHRHLKRSRWILKSYSSSFASPKNVADSSSEHQLPVEPPSEHDQLWSLQTPTTRLAHIRMT